MEQMKYIVVETGMYENIYLFPDYVQHAEFAQNVRFGDQEIVAAGFVNYGSNGRLFCHGRSVGLEIDSRNEEDTDLLDRMLRGNNPY